MDTSRIDGVKAPQHRGTPSSHLQDGLDALLFFDGLEPRLLALPLDLLEDGLGLLELLLDLALALRVPNSGFSGDARLRLESHGLQLLGDLPFLLGDGAHRLKFFGYRLRAPRLHLLLLRLDLRWSSIGVSFSSLSRLEAFRGPEALARPYTL